MIRKTFKISLFIAFSFFSTTFSLINAQEGEAKITTAVPFLQVAADARSGGMADQGVATAPDVFSQQWNSSKYAFALREIGVGLSITPYLTKIVDDITLMNLSGYKKLDDRSAVAASFRYFSLGEIEFRESGTSQAFIQKPNEMSFDVSYSLKLNEYLAMSVAARYLRSDLKLQTLANSDANPGSSFGMDITGYFQSEETQFARYSGRWRAGFAITNIGPKMKYSEGQESFIPTNLRIGGGYDFKIDEFNVIRASLEFSKLLVPTPELSIDVNGDGEITADEIQSYQDYVDSHSAIGSIFTSFADAPGGFSEELREFTTSIGAEYIYDDVFALRAGYFNEHEDKGGRKFFSFGAGFTYTSVSIDMSYLFSTSSVPSPLEGTLRFGLTFQLGQEYLNY